MDLNLELGVQNDDVVASVPRYVSSGREAENYYHIPQIVLDLVYDHMKIASYV